MPKLLIKIRSKKVATKLSKLKVSKVNTQKNFEKKKCHRIVVKSYLLNKILLHHVLKF